MKLIYFKDKKGEWRWHIKARNGRIIACSGEGYKSGSTMMKSVEKLVRYVISYHGS